MSLQLLLLIVFGSALICYAIERRVAWIAHVSSVCLLILFAMLLSQIGIVPSQSELYETLQGPIVLIAIVMMTLDFKFQDILKVPFKIVIVFLFGIFGSLLGGLIAGAVSANSLGINAYKIAAQLTASYIGGLENAAAMQKLLDIPNNYFIAVFALDSVVTSLWLIICIWYGSDKGEDIKIAENDGSAYDGVKVSIVSLLVCLFVSLGLVMLADFLAKNIGFMHKILWLSILALCAGQLPFFKNHFKPAYVLGAILFAGFFFSVGAVSDLKAILHLPKMLIFIPIIIIFTHALFIIVSARIFKLNKIALSITSQALIGGPGTAVAVAQVRKWKSGVAIAIILGVLGYSIANFFGAFVFNFLQYLLPQ
ncbi:DUF819 family protein [Fluviispira sanaruensis]|uniref:DUF819 domain-containing protein n=1 Tax=Fluviispira sanaruensis TaxID=2493639 RepID=A0A4P2VLW4_FLUSA|nr:DUF819 family protein [Fluviispira sanaruensis]BBH52810.1 DUF819 domain-containing protein [Fluviispira sanaruensis]